jgi:hypothetical protein
VSSNHFRSILSSERFLRNHLDYPLSPSAFGVLSSDRWQPIDRPEEEALANVHFE